MSAARTLDTLPDVIEIDELAAFLGVSARTIARRLEQGAFPVRPLPSFDRKTRFGKASVIAFLAGKVQR